METKGFIREHKFHKDRRWRMDYANLKLMIAVEIEGGLWIQGRHNRATGMINDMEKYNEATLAGWDVYRVTPDMVKDGTAYQLVERILKRAYIEAYLEWTEKQKCIDCGVPASERKERGTIWVDEIQCLDCLRKFGTPESRGLPSVKELAAKDGIYL